MKTLLFLGLSTLLCATWIAPAARADIVYQTAPGATAGGEAVNAKATFTVSAGAITVKLENLIVDQMDVGQSITRVTFTTNSSTAGASLASSTGIQRDLTASPGGGFTYTDTILNAPNKNNTGWGILTGSNQLSLDWFSRDKSIAGQMAEYTLIGQPGGNNKYNNANSSLTNGDHDPSLAGPLYFTLNGSGITANTQITGVTFFFGTSLGPSAQGVLQQPTPAPAPAALVLAASGLGSLGLFRLCRRRRAV
jgi:hypothetical protein